MVRWSRRLRFNRIKSRWLLILVLVFIPGLLSAKEKDFTRVVKTSSKKDIANVNARVPRSNFDKDIDEMIEQRLGTDYRRANVFDFYPLELPSSKARWKSTKKQIELMNYYEYARKDLEKLNQSKLLRVIKADLNQDSQVDYAVIVWNLKKKKNYLAIMNYQEQLYLKPFEASYLEVINNAAFPTTVVYQEGKKRKTLTVPSFRMVAFDDISRVLYFDKESNKWRSLAL